MRWSNLVSVNNVNADSRDFDSNVTSARAAREYAVDALTLHGADEAIIQSFELAISELVANVVQHGSHHPFAVQLHFDDPHEWRIVVASTCDTPPAHLLHPVDWFIASYDADTGRGLGIVGQVTDHVTSDYSDGVLQISCIKDR